MSLSFFPGPYPDEILYSLIARYHVRARNHSPRTTVEQLFGAPYNIGLGLPSYLAALTARLESNTLHTCDRLIENHTFFPFYRAFLTPERAQQVKLAMINDQGAYRVLPSRLVGENLGIIKSPPTLRYCSACISQDTNKFGQPYWHRVHQVPGVLFCPLHDLPLTSSEIPYAYTLTRTLTTLAEVVRTQEPDGEAGTFVPGYAAHAIANAKMVHWLLNHVIEPVTMEDLRERYIWFLSERGYRFVTRQQNQTAKLSVAFHTFYGSEYLELLNCALGSDVHKSWMTNLIRRSGTAVHPIRHVLFIHFLSIPPEQFFAARKPPDHPFGNGPWPCFNPAADHYLQPVVTTFKVKRRHKVVGPIGVFACECGFVYERKATDVDSNGKPKIGRIVYYGSKWQERFTEVIMVEKKSVAEAARLLNIPARTAHVLYKNFLTTGAIRKRQTDYTKELTQRREQWLQLLDDHPTWNTAKLKGTYGAEYAWLFTNDRDWLMENRGVEPDAPVPPEQSGKTRVDWNTRDDEMLALLKEAVAELKEKQWVRIRPRTLEHHVGKRSLMLSLNKMPKTSAFIQQVVESVDDFHIRKVSVVAKVLREERGPWSLQELLHRAQLYHGRYSERVAAHIEAELERSE